MTTLTVSQHALTQSHNDIKIIAMLQLWMDRHTQRKQLHLLLNWLIPETEKLKLARKVRWSLDVDPIDLY